MKQPYQAPAFHLLPGVPGMTGEELAALSDEALEKVLRDNGFDKNKKRYRAHPDFLLREVAGEALLMPTGTAMSGMMLSLSETAAFLWRLLETPKTVQDLVFAARAEYADDSDAIESGIREFITVHIQSGLILEEE